MRHLMTLRSQGNYLSLKFTLTQDDISYVILGISLGSLNLICMQIGAILRL